MRCSRYRADERYCQETRRNELVGLPLIGTGLGEVEVGEDTVDELARHLRGGLGPVVERGNGGKDGGSGISGEGHVAKVDTIEGRLADAEQEWAALLEADIGGAMDKVGGEAVSDSGEGSHGAGQDDHSIARAAAAGDAGADVGFNVLGDFGGGCAEELLRQVIPTPDLQLGREDAESVIRGDEVDAFDTRVGDQGSKHLRGID